MHSEKAGAFRADRTENANVGAFRAKKKKKLKQKGGGRGL